ncbi:MAG TPA: ABC transporter ATP-binding protein [Lichenihabitans sp.]|nr:ABC transporter ATP-binding protein [Lichenihabitans sp.]
MTDAARGDDAAPILLAETVVKRFGGVAAVDGLSFAVRRGEILGLIGPNGAGKTTMFDLMAGRLRPDGGRILLDGRDIGRLPPHRRAALGLGRTFQIPRPFPDMTVVENVMLGRQGQPGESVLANFLRLGHLAETERETYAQAMDLVDFVTLTRLAHAPARTLSGGQRKLLELARVLMGRPRLMLLDEPAAGVNPSLLEVIIERIAAINARGITLLIIEHNMELVARLCPRLIAMAAGTLLAEGRPDVVTRDSRVIESYLGGVAA